MVSRKYALERREPPSPLKRFIDLWLFPTAIDAVASVELAIERVTVFGRARPVIATGTALAVGCLAGGLYRRSNGG